MNIQEAENLLFKGYVSSYIEEEDELTKAEELLLNFDDGIEKAVAQVGETREWSDGTYKKVSEGKWVKVTNGKEKSVAGSGMIKKVKDEIQSNREKWDDVKITFENSLESKFTKGTTAYKVFFENAWYNETQKNEFLQKIRAKQKDLNDEIKEIEKAIAIDKKSKREIKTGKRELDVDDLKSSLGEAKEMLKKVNKEIPRRGSAKEIIPQVTIDDYYLDTETTYQSILSKEDTWKEIDERWKEMKESGKYHWHQSPKSSSEYLIDEKNGDVYRYSDHWGRVASCSWDIESESEQKWDIAKSNIKDFKRKDSGIYFNPQYRIKMVEAAEIILPRMKNLVSENKDFYLTDKAKKSVKEFTENIFRDLQWSALMSIDEVERLRKKYEAI
ncbi:MAG: hypothetical protein QM751_08280 [Paludibacteraceae bacterium]